MIFTKDILAELHSGDLIRMEAAEQLSLKKTKEYSRALKKILPKLNKDSRAFYQKQSFFHDYSVLSFSTGEIWRKKETLTYAKIVTQHESYIYTLTYKKIRHLLFDYPSDFPLWNEGKAGKTYGLWYHDELSLTKDGWMLHEILLESGATITIEFKHFSYRRHRDVLL